MRQKPTFRKAVLCLIMALVTHSLFSYAHSTQEDVKFTMKGTKVSYIAIFKEIKRQTGLIVWANEEISMKVANSIFFENTPLGLVMNKLLPATYTWKIQGNDLFISKTDKAVGADPKVNNEMSKANVTDTANMLVDISGVVTDEKGNPIPGATVLIKNSNKGTQTEANGFFRIKAAADAVMVVRSIGFNQQEIALNNRSSITIKLAVANNQVQGIEVVSTGYQQLPKERATGAFTFIDNQLINRSISTNILDRLNGVTSGLTFNTNRTGNDPIISIRGRSTIFANTDPLIVVDNWPYDGDISTINPNDVESITILKDAAAASIWGVRSGNGVIVITTKKGRLEQIPKLSFSTNLSYAEKPNLYYPPQLSSSEFIEIEKFLFDKGVYDNYLQNQVNHSVSQVVELLDKQRMGQLSQSAVESQLKALSQYDVRSYLNDHFVNNALNQQYNINVNGGGRNQTYYISGGYDNNRLSQVGNRYERYTFNVANSFYLLNRRLELGTNFVFTNTTSATSPTYLPKYPYERPVDENGNALRVVGNQSLHYIDTAGGGRLLDWSYYPYNERESTGHSNTTDYRVNLKLGYRIAEGLKAAIEYQYAKGVTQGKTENGLEIYSTRNLINRYTVIDNTTGQVTYNIPIGSILNRVNTSYSSKNIRGILTFDRQINIDHSINAIVGIEQRSVHSDISSNQLFGYNSETETSIPVDLTHTFPLFDLGGQDKIPNLSTQGRTVDNFRSYFINAGYTFKERYTFTASARSDESNLFGVKTNQKKIPLWSLGGKWRISSEPFYKFGSLPDLNFRITYGYNGNVDKSVTAYTTALVNGGTNVYNNRDLSIINPPNPSLRWEKVAVTDFGIDFALKNSVVVGSVDYFIKNGTDLIGFSALPPQSGRTEFRGNSSNTRTRGIEVKADFKVLNSEVKWTISSLFNYVKDEVTSFKARQGANFSYATGNYSNPMVGKPYSSLFSFKWNGLDTLGNPIGSLDGKVTTEYVAILNSTNTSELIFNGTQTPQVFGAIRNTINWNHIDVSFNVTYKFKYVFRRPSLNNSALYSTDPSYLMADYANRWKKPGDETTTNVPSLVYPYNNARDLFYQNSSVLVEKGDHIRLQDVQVGYTFNLNRIGVSSIRLNGYINNIGILWRKNSHGLDPDVINGLPNARIYSVGINATL